jgi:hypothetical protein
VVVAGLIVASWIVTIARAIPLRDGDRGIFASMAERLAAGDTLYVDVWDNKEPLFYLTLAAGRLVSPYMDVVIELGWLAASAVAIYLVLRSSKVPAAMSALAGLGMTPLILTGGDYAAGFSHLPGTAILLGTYALLVRGRPAVAGALVPVLAAFKVIMLPMMVAVFAVQFLVDRDRRALVRSLVGAGISTGAVALLLAVRGELAGFIDLLKSNIGYSQSSISDAYQVPIWKHIEPVMQGPAMATAAGIVVILALTWLLARGAALSLWWTTTATFAMALLITAATGLWSHHGQILFAPAALALALMVVSFPQLQRVLASAVVLVLASTVVLAGAPSLRSVVDTGLSASARWTALAPTATATQDLLAIAPEGGTYARLGKNTEDSHAQGLRAFEHRCRQFVQYTYDLPSTLDLIPGCLPSVDYVIVDKGLVPQEGADLWNRFVERSEAALAASFTCEERSWGRLCSNSGLGGNASD